MHSDEGAAAPSKRPIGKTILIALLVCVGIGVVVVPAALLRNMMRPPASVSVATLSSTKAGEAVDLVVEVTGVSSSTIAGQLLDANSDGTYRRTLHDVHIFRHASTVVEMGSPADIRPASVISVHALGTGEPS